ncbi:MAG: hypothetical protein J6D47_20095 [Peptostreptococcaceae bacterium]|nr:hypothetical protein [Peptostreptococcaceae bacterium]
MTREDLEVKIELTETNIELLQEVIEFNKKTNRTMIIISVIVYAAIVFANLDTKNFDIMEIFAISFLTTSTYYQINKMIDTNREDRLKLRQLITKLQYYKGLLKYKE